VLKEKPASSEEGSAFFSRKDQERACSGREKRSDLVGKEKRCCSKESPWKRLYVGAQNCRDRRTFARRGKKRLVPFGVTGEGEGRFSLQRMLDGADGGWPNSGKSAEDGPDLQKELLEKQWLRPGLR